MTLQLAEAIVPAAFDVPRLKGALRTALGCVAALMLILVYRFPFGVWALVTILVMTQPNVGASISKGFMRVFGTILGGVFGLVLLHLVQEPLPFLALAFAMLTITSYFGSGQVYPYAFVVGGLTAIIIGTLGLTTPEMAVNIAFYRMGEIALGVLIAVGVSLAVFPLRATVELPRRLAAALETCRAHLATIASAQLTDRALEASNRRPGRDLVRLYLAHAALLDQACYESQRYARRRNAFLGLILSLDHLFTTVVELGALPPSADGRPFHRELAPELKLLAAALDRALGALDYSVRQLATLPERDGEVESALAAVADRYASLRATGRVKEYPLAELERFDSFVLGLTSVARAAGAASRVIAKIANSDLRDQGAAQSPRPASQSAGRYALNERRVKYSLKCAIATLATLLLFVALQWPGGLEAVISAYLVTHTSIGGSNRKALLRLIGACCGGVLAFLSIAYVVPHIETAYAFSVVVFTVVFACAWVILGSEQVSYGGLQAALAYVLTLFPTAMQPISLTPAVQRFIGVFMGGVVSGLVLRLIWPTNARREMRDELATVLRGMADLFGELVRGSGGHGGSRLLDGDVTRRVVAGDRIRALRAQVDGCIPLVAEAALEGGPSRITAKAGLVMVDRVEGLLLRLDAVADAVALPIDSALLREVSRGTALLEGEVRAALRGMADALGEHPSAPPSRPADIDGALAVIDRRLAELRASGTITAYPAADRTALLSLAERLTEFARAVEREAARPEVRAS